MGTWGAGVFENDHALDLFSGYENKLVDDLRATLALAPVAFDDIEGPLVYVRLLTALGAQAGLRQVRRDEVHAWRRRYLEIFVQTYPDADSEYAVARRAVILSEFEALSACARHDSGTPATSPPLPGARATKTPGKRTLQYSKKK